jgi:hypothetical protein
VKGSEGRAAVGGVIAMVMRRREGDFEWTSGAD